MSWLDRFCWPRAAISDLQRDVAAGYVLLEEIRKSNVDIKKELIAMGVREDAAAARMAELVQLVKDGSAAKDAKIAALEAELANSDADAQARVDAALEADSEFDAGRIEAANTALEELVAVVPPVEPTE